LIVTGTSSLVRHRIKKPASAGFFHAAKWCSGFLAATHAYRSKTKATVEARKVGGTVATVTGYPWLVIDPRNFFTNQGRFYSPFNVLKYSSTKDL
jgi:hypothetical protein